VRARALAPAALLLLSGCIDFVRATATEPPSPWEPARAAVTVTLVDVAGPADSLVVEGDLAAGRDSAGRRRAVADPVLRVGGRAVAPGAGSDSTITLYRATWGAEPARFATGAVAVDLPVVAGAPFPQPRASGFLPATRSGPDTVRVAPGGTIVLRIRPGETPLLFTRWALHLARGTRSVTVASSSPPPAELVVPASWLPEGDGPVAAALYVDGELVAARAEDRHWANVRLASSIRWRVVFEE
jgi:hypothetical protein